MFRVPLLAGFVLVSLASTGCIGTWDTITSRRFREHPWPTLKKMCHPEDPIAVLLADPPRDGDERASAMHRLQEPNRIKASPEVQEAIMTILEKAATSDPNPYIRMEAITTLGRFEDDRAAGILMAAYQNAHGRRPGDPIPPKSIVPAGGAGHSAGRKPTQGYIESFSTLTGPSGFQPDWVMSIRCRAAESLGQTNRPEAVKFLAMIAGGAGKDISGEGSDDRDIRLAAVRGLSRCRQPESVVVLAKVLAEEMNGKRDTALIDRTHEGLVKLTGKKLPPDPQTWDGVVQAGVVIVPEPSKWETTIEQAAFWKK